MPTRRDLCKTLTLGALFYATPALAATTPQRLRYPPPVQARPRLESFVQELRMPGSEGLMAEVALEKPLHLTSIVEPTNILDGPPTLLWSYVGERDGRLFKNPLLRVRRGATLDVRFENRLEESSTIHWHGLNVTEANDGSGLHPVARGEQWHYRYKIINDAATYWYHPHPHYRTGMQIHKGMAGMLLVEDEREDALREALGLTFGINDIPLLIQDKQVGPTNQFEYEFGEDDWIGNRVLVNFSVEPRLVAERRLYRFRLLNASNARPFRLAWLVDGEPLPFHLLGSDSGLFDRLHTVREVYLAPAQRLDVLIDFSRLPRRTRVKLASLAFDPMENDGAPLVDPAMEHPGAVPLGEALDIMAIDLDGRSSRSPRLPSRPGTAARLSDGRTDRSFRLHIENCRWLINGRNHHDDHDRARFDVVRGSREVWEFRNDTRSMPHPMHAHAFRFRVLERIDSPPQVGRLAIDRRGRSPHDLGWLDTVLIWPGERVRVEIDFTQPYRGDQTYMLHCHNLEHEDQGLMLNFRVRDA